MSAGATGGLLVEPEGAAINVELVAGDVTARTPLHLFWRRFNQKSDYTRSTPLGSTRASAVTSRRSSSS